MLILSRVCAECHNRQREQVHRVTPANHFTFHEAPEFIREDPLLRMLAEDGLLEAGVTPVRKTQLEAHPLERTTPAGRKARSAAKALRLRPGQTNKAIDETVKNRYYKMNI